MAAEEPGAFPIAVAAAVVVVVVVMAVVLADWASLVAALMATVW